MSILITCHANADFDAFAAMIAVRHFYPNPQLLFPGTQENRIKRYLAKINKATYGFIEASQVQWETIDTLIIVDTRQPGRVSHIAPLLKKEDLTIEIWDHHPQTSKDFSNATIFQCQCGAVTSYLVTKLKEKHISITKEEATILALGIYEDTGAFTYSSTRAEDFQAAAWLAEQGMNINEIAELEMHQLNERQIQLLNGLIESSQTYRVQGHTVTIADMTLEESYDCAFLAYQLLEMGKHQVVFALFQMEERIHVIARSKTKDINVGAICSLLGGGGHTYAASASVKNITIPSIKDAILRQLHLQDERKTVRSYMSTPPIGIQTSTLIREADEMMFHFGLKSVPVYKPGTHTLVGIFDVETSQRAMNHQLSGRLVEDYMQRHIETVSPNASMSDVAKIIIDNNQRMVPVVENDTVVGIMTRTDLVNIFAEISMEDTPRGTKYYHIEKVMFQQIPAWIRDLLATAGTIGRKLQLAVYIVGGFVRDYLLQVPNHDVDFVVEGNGELFAKHLAKELNGRVSHHEKFMTAIVIYQNAEGNPVRVDVATARLEYYEHPAALPMVEVSPLKLDLARRDFTMNALAVRLDKESDHLVDFFGGQRDIKDGVIRVLHTLSFVEDPTRCLRAVRFAKRYGFRISKSTEKLIRNAVALKVLDRLKHHRLLHEFTLICQEQDPVACFIHLDNLGILRELFPKTVLSKNRKRLLDRIRQHILWYQMLYLQEPITPWILYLLGLNYGLSYKDTKRNLEALNLEQSTHDYILTRRNRAVFLTQKAEIWCTEQKTHTSISALYKLLKGVEINLLLFCMALNKKDPLSKYLSQYVTKWRQMQADIRGSDLQDLGIPPGPIYARILERVLYAKLDKEVTDRESQLELAKKLAQKPLLPPAP